MKITAKINPVPLARTRVNTTNRGRFVPQRSQQFKSDLAAIARAQMAGVKPFDAPLKVLIHFHKKLKRTSRKFGDLDNHVKAVLDALNGVVWQDDSLIVELHAFKYSGEPLIEIEIEEWQQ